MPIFDSPSLSPISIVIIYMNLIYKKRPPRLPEIFQCYNPPLYFVTINTLHRRPLLLTHAVLEALIAYAQANAAQGRTMGRFVIMPDHIHFFVRLGTSAILGDCVRLLKQTITRKTGAKDLWQPGFFDHLLRNSESYFEKVRYVRDNPVRANLVAAADEWPWQGEIAVIDRV